MQEILIRLVVIDGVPECRQITVIGEPTELRPRTRGPFSGPSADDLRAAAELYRHAEHAPTRAVAEKFNIAHRTASLWIKRAREAGLL